MRLHRVHALLLKYWYVSTADLSRMFDMVYWPLLGLIVFGFTAVYMQHAANIPAFAVLLIGGMILFILFDRIQQDVAIFLLEDFWSRNIANLFITPVTTGELFVALSIIGVLRAMITGVVMYAIALLAYQFNLIGLNPASLLFVIPLVIFGWALGLLSMGFIFRFGQRIQVIAWSFTYLLQPIGATYYPLAALPKFLQILSYGTPLMYTFEGYRLAYAGTFSWLYLISGIVIALIYLAICFLIFNMSIRAARRIGLLTRN